jgi:two-component system, chemotaxis family, CheB/CheR fusion protein
VTEVTRDESFETLLRFLRESRGFDFTGYKRTSLMRRVRHRMDHAGYGLAFHGVLVRRSVRHRG